MPASGAEKLTEPIARCVADLTSEERTLARLRADFDALTPREREVMMMVAAGRLNKRIAWDLRLSEATVKAHRTEVMHKMRLGRWLI